MKWLAYAMLAPLLWSLSNLIDKIILSRYIQKIITLVMVTGMVSLVVAVGMFVWSGVRPLSAMQLWMVLFSGAGQIVMLVLYFKALSTDEPSRVVPLFQMTPVFILILGYVFLKEELKPVFLTGFALVLSGSFILSIEKFQWGMFQLRPSFYYVMVSALFGALSTVCFKAVLEINDFWTVFAYENMGVGLGGIALFLFPTYRRDFLTTVYALPRALAGWMVFNESLYIVGRMGARYAMTFVPVALVSVVVGLSPLFLFIFGTFMTLYFPKWVKEDITKRAMVRKSISILIIFLGIYFIER
jgi:uncharacterized membrane protein